MLVFFLALALLGFWMMKRGLDKVRIVIASVRWPRVPLQDIGVGTRHHTTTSIHSGPLLPHEAPYNSSVEVGPFYTRVTRSEFYPVLTYGYQVNGRIIRGANVDAWNSGGYSGSDVELVKETHRAWAQGAPCASVDPVDPRRHVLGWAHFPLGWTAFELVAGWFLATGLAVFLGDLTVLAGYEEPTFGEARRSAFILLPPIIGLLYLVLGRTKVRPSR